MIDVMRYQNTAGDGTITKLEILFDDTSPRGKVRLGVYADNNGEPGNLLLNAGEAVVTNGWVSISGLNLAVTENTYYWLAFSMECDNIVRTQGGQPPRSHYWANRSYGPFPSSYPGSNYNGYHFVMRATVTK